MKLVYITAVQIPADDAQSKQIFFMAEAFSRWVDFILISPKNEKNKNMPTSFKWKKVVCPFKKRSIRNLLVSLAGIREVKKDVTVYTRDIFVAYFFYKLGYKTVYEFHKPIITSLGRFLLTRVKRDIKFVSISGGLKEFLICQEKIPAENIFIAHDGVDIQRFEAVKEDKLSLRKKFGLPEDKFIVMYCGSLYEGKGVEIMIEMAKYESEILFVVIGGPETLIDKWQQVNLENLKFLGYIPNEKIPFILKSADVLVLPLNKKLSYWKYTSPLKLFEYMASGVPILSSNIGSIPEVLNERNAYLFDPEDIQDAINKLRYIKENYTKALTKAKQAYEDAKSNYTWDIRAKKILEFIGESYGK
jgi:glycosyltransferase involved in cell wall biosynthesis